jgi:hypothetical protein
MEVGGCRATQIFHNTKVGMKRVMFLLIGIMMAGGMAAATGNDSAIKATIPIGSTIVIPVSEGSKEVVFDVEGVELIALSDLEAVEGGRPVRDDLSESVAYSRGQTNNKYGDSDQAALERFGQWWDKPPNMTREGATLIIIGTVAGALGPTVGIPATVAAVISATLIIGGTIRGCQAAERR